MKQNTVVPVAKFVVIFHIYAGENKAPNMFLQLFFISVADYRRQIIYYILSRLTVPRQNSCTVAD
jgi:hypothetical protein